MDVHGDAVVCQKPNTLYACCIRYIASNLPLIESLVGFPEVVGKEIFQVATAVRDGLMMSFTSSSGRQSLRVFFDAYGDSDILPSLSLDREHVFFNEIIDDCWWVFEHLVHLDLSSCGIGDRHDFLTVLDRMLRLETLSLRDNQVTDEGIRRMTVKSRMSQKNSLVLKNLDISSNFGITVRCVNFLRCLSSLELLNISDTSITFKETIFLNNWKALTDCQDICSCFTSRFLVKTSGWAADLVESWKGQCHMLLTTGKKSNTPAEPLSSAVAISRQQFYSKSALRTNTNSSPSVSTPSSASSACKSKQKAPLMLITHVFSCPHHQPQTRLFDQRDTDPSSPFQPVPISTVSRLRVSSAGEHNLHQGKCAQIPPEMLTNCNHDDNVLSHYCYSPPRKKQKKPSVLQLLDDCF